MKHYHVHNQWVLCQRKQYYWSLGMYRRYVPCIFGKRISIIDGVEIQDGEQRWIKFTEGDIKDIREQLLGRKDGQAKYAPMVIEGKKYKLVAGGDKLYITK